MGKAKEIRIFNGQRYRRAGFNSTKAAANREAKKMRAEGSNARIVKGSTIGVKGYVIYTRKSKRPPTRSKKRRKK